MTGDRRTDELKHELDRVLRENQELHTALRRLNRPRFLARRLAGQLWRGIRARWSARMRRGTRGHATATSDAGFTPYVVLGHGARRPGRPRILHLIGNFHTGGSARLVVDLVEQLSERFDQITVARDLPPTPHYTGLDLRGRPLIRSRQDAEALLAEISPDLVHVHFLGHHGNHYSQRDWDWYQPLFAALETHDVPVVENINIPVAPYFSSAVSCYVFVSDTVRSVFAPSGARSQTIYPGSNFQLFTRPESEIPPDDCLGMVYRLEKDKLDESVIDIFTAAVRARPRTQALIVGGGRYLDSYRSRVRSAGVADSVRFTGYVGYDALAPLYRQFSVFVAPPHTESFGHVVPLAMGMGLPVVAYDVGALPEILGPTGLLIEPGDTDAMAKAAVDLLNDRDRRLAIGAANRRRAHERFSVQRMVDDYDELYTRLLPSAPPSQPRRQDPIGTRR